MSFIKLLNTYAWPPIEDNLHVIAVISNPCLYRRRYQLAREFIERMHRTPNVILYVVELAYGDQQYAVTQAGNPRHLQLHATTPIWHKENMINLSVRHLLPSNWKALAWIDADVEFENPHWAQEALRTLSRVDVIQPFQQSIHLDKDGHISDIARTSTCALASGRMRPVWGNCGYAWAMTRQAYERVGGLYEHGIMGGGDAIMSKAFTKHGTINGINSLSPGFQSSISRYNARAGTMKIGFVPGKLYHYFHGELKNRKYTQRWGTLIGHQYDPTKHLTKDARGVLVPTAECPQALLDDILKYFQERNEDESTYEHPVEPPVSVANEHTPAASSQYTGSQLPVEASAPQYETTLDSESYAVPNCGATSADTLNSKNAHAISSALECERVPETAQTSSIG